MEFAVKVCYYSSPATGGLPGGDRAVQAEKGQTIMRRDVWFFLFFLGVLLFGWPLMSIFRNGMAIYLFTVWLVFIVLILIISIFSEREDGG